MRLCCIIIPYFGKPPFWLDYFLLSCSYNPKISWIIYHDHPIQTNFRPSNVTFIKTTFLEYSVLISNRLGISFNLLDAYKLNDIKPFLGFIHQKEITNFKFWGFGDLDVIYGDIQAYLIRRSFYDIISFHHQRVAGHLTFIRNIPCITNQIFKIPDWKNDLENPVYLGFDEGKFSYYFRKHFFKFSRGVRYTEFLQPIWLRLVMRKALFKEEFTTPITGIPWRDGSIGMDQPDIWEWNQGIVRSCRDFQESPYLHFMCFKECRWSTISLWNNAMEPTLIPVDDSINKFFISRLGFTENMPEL